MTKTHLQTIIEAETAGSASDTEGDDPPATIEIKCYFSPAGWAEGWINYSQIYPEISLLFNFISFVKCLAEKSRRQKILHRSVSTLQTAIPETK